ncbi:MAG: hypothetical protein SWH61_15680 [Thermodesulfobacteriota bacterium]|nr:hypothetical protein [Thermodesulfobacteriota bacterium]
MQLPDKYTQKVKAPIIILAIISLAAQFAYESVYVINPGEQIIVSRFGKIIKGPIKTPGYHFKLGNADQVVRYPSEQTNVQIDFRGCPPRAKPFRADMNFIISNPISFYQRVQHVDSLPKIVSFMLKEKCCKKSYETNEENYSSILDFIKTEAKSYGISVNNINIKG